MDWSVEYIEVSWCSHEEVIDDGEGGSDGIEWFSARAGNSSLALTSENARQQIRCHFDILELVVG